jgi:hypothetical protein
MKHFEDNIQRACVTWFRLQYPSIVIFSIPNGGYRNPDEAAKMKGTGTLSGVVDMFVMTPKFDMTAPLGLQYVQKCGLFIELKAGKNLQTAAQKEFQTMAEFNGYEYHVCRSFDEFKEIIEKYLN